MKQNLQVQFLFFILNFNKKKICVFEDLDIKIKPKEGRAIVWNNMNEDGECEEKSIHSANIVGDEEGKFVLQQW